MSLDQLWKPSLNKSKLTELLSGISLFFLFPTAKLKISVWHYTHHPNLAEISVCLCMGSCRSVCCHGKWGSVVKGSVKLFDKRWGPPPQLALSLPWLLSPALALNLQTHSTESDAIKGLFELFLCLKVWGQNIYSDTSVADKSAWGDESRHRNPLKLTIFLPAALWIFKYSPTTTSNKC